MKSVKFLMAYKLFLILEMNSNFVFRNGIFLAGVYYNPVNDHYIKGSFNNGLKVTGVGKGFPYK